MTMETTTYPRGNYRLANPDDEPKEGGIVGWHVGSEGPKPTHRLTFFVHDFNNATSAEFCGPGSQRYAEFEDWLRTHEVVFHEDPPTATPTANPSRRIDDLACAFGVGARVGLVAALLV